MGKYLDQNGLRYFWQKVKSEIQKSSGVTPSAVLDLVYPIGSIFEWCDNGITTGVDLSNVNRMKAHFGGEWESFGEGRVLVAFSPNDPPFNEVGGTGGERTHTLTVDEMPSHNHLTYISSKENGGGWNWYAPLHDSYTDQSQETRYAGGDQPHNNLQPYVIVYRYRRIG